MPNTLKANVEGLDFRALRFPPTGDSKDTTLFCLPGGGASANFFDLEENYSLARRMSAKGYAVITMDHPGTATNPLPLKFSDDYSFLKPRKAADLVAAFIAKWTNGDVIGIGHSMGGMVTTLIQARHKSFKAIGLLGSSAGGLDWGLTEDEKAYIEKPEDFERDLEELTLAKFKMPFIKGGSGPSGKSITFGGETPALTERLREISCELYAAGGLMSMTRGSFRAEVKAIDVPMFLAFGDHDIGIPPEDAPKDYINAPSYDLVVLENTGHNSLAFRSIKTLCERLDYWASSLD